MKKILLASSGVIIFIFLWAVLTVSGIVDPLFLPTPWAAFKSLFSLFFIDKTIYPSLFASLRRMLFGFVIGVGTGIPVGIILGASKRLYATSEILIEFMRSVPSTAFFPLFMLIWGVNDGPKVSVVAFGCFFICIINSAYGVMHCSPVRTFAAQIMGASRWFIFLKVRLPESLPSISTGIRVSISYAIVLVIVSEMFVGTDIGLGRMIYDSHTSYHTDKMYALIITTGAIGYIANKLYTLLEKKFFHWSGKSL